MTRTEIERLAVVETHVDDLLRCVADMDEKLDDIQARLVAKDASDKQVGVVLGRANRLLITVILVSNFVLGTIVAVTQ